MASRQSHNVGLAKRVPFTMLLDKLDDLCRRNELNLDELAQYRGLRALEAELASPPPAGLECRMATIELDLPPVAVAVPRTRHRFQALLAAVGVPEEVCDAAVLVVSELVTNGVIHNSGEDIVI